MVFEPVSEGAEWPRFAVSVAPPSVRPARARARPPPPPDVVAEYVLIVRQAIAAEGPPYSCFVGVERADSVVGSSVHERGLEFLPDEQHDFDWELWMEWW